MHSYPKAVLYLFLILLSRFTILAEDSNEYDTKSYMMMDPVSKAETFVFEAGMKNDECIVLIHGAGEEASRIWRYLIPDLAQDYHVVTFDLPGYGRSSKQNLLYSPLFYSRFVGRVIDRYVEEKPFTIIAHSLGGAVAIAYSAGQPENLQRLILVDVSGVIHRLDLTTHIIGNIHEKKDGLLSFPTKLFGKITSNAAESFENPELSDELDKILESPESRNRYLNGDPDKIAALALANFDFSTYVYNIDVPAVIIWGEDDLTTPVRTGVLLHYIIDKSQFNIVPDTGHNPVIDKHVLFNRMIRGALSTETWEPSVNELQETDRTGVFSNEHDLELTGYYKSIELSGCSGIRMRNLQTEFIKVVGSNNIVIENSRISGKKTALFARSSTIELTAVELSGEDTIVTSGSNLDLAGVSITGSMSAVRAENGSELLFSVSKIESPYTSGYIHGYYLVVPDEPM